MDAEGRTSGLERPDIEPPRFVELACRALGAAADDLRTPGQGAAASRLRYLVAALAIERWRIRSGQLSELVGRRPEVVSRWARRGGELRLSDPSFAAALDEADTTVSRALAD